MNLIRSYKKSLTNEINAHVKKLRQQLNMVHPRYVKYIIKQKSVKNDMVQIDTKYDIIDHTIESAGKEFLNRYQSLQDGTKASYYSYIVYGFVRSSQKTKDKNIIKQNYINAKKQIVEVEKKQNMSINYCVTLMNSISKSLEKSTKGTKIMKEATEYQEIHDNIDKAKKILYEKCSSGEITVDEREILLEEVNSMIPIVERKSNSFPVYEDKANLTKSDILDIFYTKLKKELAKDDESGTEETPKDESKPSTMKESAILELYNRHAAGNITLDEREALIHKVKLM